MTGEELWAARAELGLSRPALAAALGVPASTVLRWERGDYPIERGVMLSLALEALASRGTPARSRSRRGT